MAGAAGGTASGASYAERLHVPLRWWVQGTMFVATLWLAMIVSLPAALAWAFTALGLVLLVLLLVSYGSPRLAVADGVLVAGRARIEGHHLGAAEALDPEATRRTAGRDADVRAYLLIRPYLKRAVKVAVTDPADPAPYWLLSTRRPERLARAITELTTDTTSTG